MSWATILTGRVLHSPSLLSDRPSLPHSAPQTGILPALPSGLPSGPAGAPHFSSTPANSTPPHTHRSDPHASPDTLDSPIRSPPRQRSHSCPQARAPHTTSPARPGASPGRLVRPPLSSRRVSPQTSALPPCLSPQARALAPALTELGDVSGHRVVLLAPVQRGRRGTPVALALRGQSHRARCRRRRRPDAPQLAALGSAGSQAGSGHTRALTACPSRTPTPRGGAGAVSGGARRGDPGHRRRQAARALPAPRPPRGRWSFPPPPAARGMAVVGARVQWFSGLPALLRHAPGCMFGAPDNPDAVLCLDVSEPLCLCVCVWFDF